MAGITVSKVVIDKSKLTNLIQRSPQKAIDLLDAMALDGEAYWKRSFTVSPSSPGEPPGVDTGALRASIHVENTGTYSRAIAAGVDYAVYLEFGTERMAARPSAMPTAVYLQKNVMGYWKNFAE